MAFTESTMIELSTQAPAFTLPDTVSGAPVSLQSAKGEQGTLILFLCNHCPYVLHVNEELVRLTNAYRERGIATIGISSNDVEKYPADSPENMKRHAAEVGYAFPYLFDEDQSVARAYDAACTPDIYLFDADLRLYYRGRLDGSRPGNNVPLTGEDLRAAIDRMLAGQPAPEKQYPSGGCNIKWKV